MSVRALSKPTDITIPETSLWGNLEVSSRRYPHKPAFLYYDSALTFTVSQIHDDAFYARLAAQMARCPDIDRVYVKDPAGLLAPERARTLIPAVRGRLGSSGGQSPSAQLLKQKLSDKELGALLSVVSLRYTTLPKYISGISPGLRLKGCCETLATSVGSPATITDHSRVLNT